MLIDILLLLFSLPWFYGVVSTSMQMNGMPTQIAQHLQQQEQWIEKVTAHVTKGSKGGTLSCNAIDRNTFPLIGKEIVFKLKNQAACMRFL